MRYDQSADFERIQKAIYFIKENFKRQPDLEEIAKHIHVSPFHLQRTFTEWAGVSPKKFLQYVTVEHAKNILEQRQATLFDTAFEAGLSGTSRLHDLFIKIEGMTPGEFKNGGESLLINYSYAASPFGNLLIASTSKGICHLSFTENKDASLVEIKNKFFNATLNNQIDSIQQNALNIFSSDWSKPDEIKLHLKGTPFQLKVWQALLSIPMGRLSTYAKIANDILNPKASRAVGSAIGINPIAYLIPCHRVILSTGDSGQYMWGRERKLAMIGWEAAKVHEKI